MDEARLDAVVARSGNNFTYLTGIVYPGTLARHVDLTDSPRGVFAVYPRHGEAVVVTNAIATGLAARDSWIERIEVYDGYSEPPEDCLCTVLRDLGLADARVGFEDDYLSARVARNVGRTLPSLQMIDCTALMDRVRWIKTPGEIERLRRGADLLDEAYLEVFPTIRDGESERAVRLRLRDGLGRLRGRLVGRQADGQDHQQQRCGEYRAQWVLHPGVHFDEVRGEWPISLVAPAALALRKGSTRRQGDREGDTGRGNGQRGQRGFGARRQVFLRPESSLPPLPQPPPALRVSVSPC